uniref:Solute carrier family 2 member 13 n=1 Tax=Oryctolagus cuniculus TaxID=9986 RepID=A0A5F9CZD9_RABIT
MPVRVGAGLGQNQELGTQFGSPMCTVLSRCLTFALSYFLTGIASMTVPVYIAEVSPPNLRGRLVTINTLFITGGQFFASVVDGAFSYLQKDGWRYMLGLAAIPAVLQFFGFLFLPESPRWLIQKGQTQKARRILSQMRGNQTIDEEYDSIKNNIEEEEKEVGSAGPVICRMLSYPPTRRALIVGCGLQMFQQLSGINTIMYYSATILQMSGVEDDRLAIWLASLTAFTNFIFTLVGVWLVEKVGRRKLTFGSLAGTTVALVILALGFLLSAQVSPRITFRPAAPSGQNTTCTRYSYCDECMLDPDCGFCYKMNRSTVVDSSCLPVNKASTSEAAWGRCENETRFKTEEVFWAYNFCPTPYSWTALLGLILYLVFFAPGMGPMPWTVNSEIYPLWARSTGNACSSGINWIFNVLVSLTFLHTAEYLTYYGERASSISFLLVLLCDLVRRAHSLTETAVREQAGGGGEGGQGAGLQQAWPSISPFQTKGDPTMWSTRGWETVWGVAALGSRLESIFAKAQRPLDAGGV